MKRQSAEEEVKVAQAYRWFDVEFAQAFRPIAFAARS